MVRTRYIYQGIHIILYIYILCICIIYIEIIEIEKKKIYPGGLESNQQDLFLPLLYTIQSVYLHYNYKRVKNPLFLQPNRSFDFGKN